MKVSPVDISPVFGIGNRVSAEVRPLETIVWRQELVGVLGGWRYRRVRWGTSSNVLEPER